MTIFFILVDNCFINNTMNSSAKIKQFILTNISLHQKDIIYTAINQFGISRQAVLKHMNQLIDDNKVKASGKTRDRRYKLIPQVNFNKTIPIKSDYTSYEGIQKNILIHLESLSKNLFQICEYSIEALVSNIVDHANASSIYVKLFLTYSDLHIVISDNGSGLFENIKSKLDLSSTQLAALEIAKGPITTDPLHQSGDGLNTIFHLFDRIKVDSSGFGLCYTNKNNQWKIDYSKQKQGTRIHLQINPNSSRTCDKIFQKLFNEEKQAFRIPISLLKDPSKNSLNSKLNAKSIFWNINYLEEIQFDFYHIDLIGPAFADELVRQSRSINRDAVIDWVNYNITVDLLMKRALKRII